MTASMRVIDTPLNDVVVKFRMRTPSDDKVSEIAESISQVGLLNPITIDKNNNLLAGFHRFLAYQKLGYDTIPSIIKDVDKKFSELVEVDENLKRNELNHIEIADHIVKRESLLEELSINRFPEFNKLLSKTCINEVFLPYLNETYKQIENACSNLQRVCNTNETHLQRNCNDFTISNLQRQCNDNYNES